VLLAKISASQIVSVRNHRILRLHIANIICNSAIPVIDDQMKHTLDTIICLSVNTNVCIMVTLFPPF
jgi:hypothetical protein